MSVGKVPNDEAAAVAMCSVAFAADEAILEIEDSGVS